VYHFTPAERRKIFKMVSDGLRYDQSGNLMEMTHYRTDGSPYVRWNYEWYPGGRIRQKVEVNLETGERKVERYRPNVGKDINYKMPRGFKMKRRADGRMEHAAIRV